jgi:hypothetical protein
MLNAQRKDIYEKSFEQIKKLKVDLETVRIIITEN